MLASGCQCGSESEPDRGASVKEARNPVAEEVEYRALEVEFMGCAASTRVPLSCALQPGENKLRLWVATDNELTVTLDGGAAKLMREPDEVVGGRLATVIIPDGAKVLAVEAGPESRPGRWVLKLVRAEQTPLLDEARDRLFGSQDASEGQIQAALETLDQLATNGTPAARVGAQRLRLLYKRGTLGPVEELEAGRAALEQALALGRPTEAIDIAQILAFDAGRVGRDGDAQELLDVQEAYLSAIGDARWTALSHYHQGALAYRQFAYGRCLDEFGAAITLFRKLGMVSEERSAIPLLMVPLAVTGRTEEFHEAVTRLLEIVNDRPAAAPCDDALNLSNAAWATVVESPDPPALRSAHSLVDRALQLESTERCSAAGRPEWADSMSLSLLAAAMISLEQQELDAAKSYLTRLAEQRKSPWQEAWYFFAEAAYANARGDSKNARRELSRLADLEYTPVDPLLEWRAATLLGGVEEELGDDDAALTHYLRAEKLVGNLARVVGVGQGREGVLTDSNASSIGAIRVLLRQGETRRAADVAGRSRSRAVRLVAAGPVAGQLSDQSRQAWAQHMQSYRRGLARLGELVARQDLASRAELAANREQARLVRERMRKAMDAAQSVASSAELTEPAPVAKGECILRFHPSSVGWVIFAIDTDGVDAMSLTSVDVADSVTATERVLEKFDRCVERSSTIVVESLGAFADVDVHQASWRDEPLLVSKRVEYSLGLGTRAPQRPDKPANALVVIDPTTEQQGRLKGARQEIALVQGALDESKVKFQLLTAHDAARGTVFDALDSVDWFHFSGHGASTGLAGWESRLLMAGSQGLEVRDILALPKGPENVVLLGCETARVSAGSGTAMHLATAFVLAGSQRVVATTRQLPDELARKFSAELYGSGPELEWDLTSMWRAAALASRGAGGDALGLRVWRP